ncbi:Molybdopterin synthase catalytic subunit [Gracilariopsis chorda]|uniref:Molybdopterin synthase catalytic subunit n=1 Tax=Gracilariopsis chorda TaxID=448386 RepID=A0A2V3J1V6_9FLOR|nr:Molybdopterin synthase catalytic subunit [Gracilariopsis chorda]|eukprot:PXF48339.1 Molybdopterin synthase catalytic subunit [Gracilariopsis chorda]
MADEDNVIVLTEEPLSVDSAMAAVSRDCAGGVSLFVGTTRDNFEGKTVVRLEYEAYHSMAIKEMRSLCDTARSKWPQITAIAIMHRLGVVPVREASVIIAVSSPHRIDAIEACHSLIDELKARVPIWKKEVYQQGSQWKANKEFKV